MTKPTANQIEKAFALLEAAAVRGERCPMSDSVPGKSAAVSALARAGRIYVEVFVFNYRVVTILEGPAKGKTTAPCPRHTDSRGQRVTSKPYLTVSAAGTFRNGQQLDTQVARRSQPSKPRGIGGTRA